MKVGNHKGRKTHKAAETQTSKSNRKKLTSERGIWTEKQTYTMEWKKQDMEEAIWKLR